MTNFTRFEELLGDLSYYRTNSKKYNEALDDIAELIRREYLEERQTR